MGFLIFSLLIALLYAVTVLSLKDGDYTIFLPVYIFYVFFYDYIFIHAAYYIDPRVLWFLRPYNEYIFLYFSLRYALNMRRTDLPADRSSALTISLALLLPSAAVILINDLRPHFHITDTVKGLRLFVLPVIIPFLMYRCGVFQRVRPGSVLRLFMLFMLFACIYGCFQRLLFAGDVESLWFYDFFDRYEMNPVYYGEANYVRNNVLRVTSIFVSPLTYSVSVSVAILIAFSALISGWNERKNATRAVYTILILFLLFCLWTAETRVGFIIVMIGIPLFLLLRMKRQSFLLLLAVPLAAVCATFILLLTGATSEKSALGRLDQYAQLREHFTPFGLGFSHGFVQTYFDTWYLSTLLLYGVFAAGPLYFVYYLIRRAYLAFKQTPHSLAAVQILVVSLTFIYTFAFQYMAGSTPYKMLFIFLFLIPLNEQGNTGATDNRSAV